MVTLKVHVHEWRRLASRARSTRNGTSAEPDQLDLKEGFMPPPNHPPEGRHGLIGSSEAMQAVYADIDIAARSDAKILLLGETGVGKEVAAHTIHARSDRRAGPFVTINCAGVPDSLLESEFFGHVRGSFTGAVRDNPGLLRQA